MAVVAITVAATTTQPRSESTRSGASPPDIPDTHDTTDFHHTETTTSFVHIEDTRAHLLIEGVRYRSDGSAIESIQSVYILQDRGDGWRVAAFSGIRGALDVANP